MKIAVCIRGHIRNGLFYQGLTDFLNKLIDDKHEVDLYLHTWNESEAKKSYRPLDRSHVFKVEKNMLYSYFKNYNIKKLIIENDKKVKINGETIGNVASSSCPLIAWKRMWAGKFKIISCVKNSNEKYDLVVNTRFDMFITPICYTPTSVLRKMCLTPSHIIFKYPKYDFNIVGVDNYYCGNIQTMYKLAYDFHHNLDDILKNYSSVIHQEEIVYRYAFDSKI